MKKVIIPISFAFLPLASCKSLKGGYDVNGPNPNISSANSKGETVNVKEDGSGKTSTTPELPPVIPTPPAPHEPVTDDGTDHGNPGGSVDIPDENPPPITLPTITLAPDPISASGGNGSNALLPNQALTDGQGLKSSDGRFTLSFHANGKLSLSYKNRTLWSTDTDGKGGVKVVLGSDGNFVILNNEGQALWASDSAGKSGSLVKLTNDGSLGVYTASGNSIWTSGTCCFPPAEAFDKRPIAVGKWGSKVNWPIIPIHSIMMPNGKVLTYGTDSAGNQGAQLYFDIWTPSLGTNSNSHQSLPNSFATDVFCGSPIVIPKSGDVLLAGGDARSAPNTNSGIKDTLILKHEAQALARGPYLANARWYATSTILPNGESLIYGGVDGAKAVVTVPEIYSPNSNSWRSLTGAASTSIMNGTESKWFYPRNFVAPDGRIFGISGELMYYLNTSGSGSIQAVGQVPSNSRSYISSAVLFEKGKILQMGGSVDGAIGQRASDQAIQIDITAGNPVITRLNPMAFERAWVSSTLLPSGDVLVTGGSAFENQLQDPAFTAELWNPVTKSFRPLLKSPIARLYHSTSLLLQDATVLIGGGGAPGPLTNTNAEIFYPPYLYDANGNLAARPSIERATGHEDYGHLSNIAVSSTIAKAVLVKTGAVTHSFDFEQRYIPLSFTNKGKTINVKMPADPNTATPGYYHLFIFNAQGVPSRSRIVALGTERDRSVLQAGDVLSIGDSVKSADGRSVLTLGADGNLVLNFQGSKIWSSETAGKGGTSATMQPDGNFVIYSADGSPLWATHSNLPQNAGGRLVLQNDANIVLLQGDSPFWTSGTVR